MNVSESLQRFGLVPSDDDLPLIRALLADEATAEREGRGRDREEDLALLCCVQLFSRALDEDILRIWDAKQSGFDLGCYLDAQFLCGGGLSETKRFLANQPGEAAAHARHHLETCEAAGNFDQFSPKALLDRYRQYFGVQNR